MVVLSSVLLSFVFVVGVPASLIDKLSLSRRVLPMGVLGWAACGVGCLPH